MYDIFTRFAPDVRTSNNIESGDTAIINKKLAEYQHPILQVSEEILKSWKPELDKKPPFSPYISKIFKHVKHDFNKLYVGYFEQYSNKWDPLIFADNNMKEPIMLCRIRKNEEGRETQFGAYILTTMYIGRTGFNPIVENILNLQKNGLEIYCKNKEEASNKTKEEETKRKKIIEKRIFAIILALIIIWALYHIYPYIIYKLIEILYGNFVLLSVTLIATVGAMLLYDFIKRPEKK